MKVRTKDYAVKTGRGYSDVFEENLNPFFKGDYKESFDYSKAFDEEGNTHVGKNIWPVESKYENENENEKTIAEKGQCLKGFRKTCEE